MRTTDVELMFSASNVEEAAVTTEQADVNAVNPDRALLRFEFLRVLARIAVNLYVKQGVEENGGKPLEVHEACERLLSTELRTRTPPEATYDPDRFRRSHLYKRQVHEVLANHERTLRPLFEYYASSVDDKLVLGKAATDTQDKLKKLMSLDEWIACLNDCGLIAPSAADDPCEFGMREAKLAYAHAHSFVTDEIYRRDRLTHMAYVEFQEAIARVAWMRNIPTPAHLQQLKMSSYAEFLQRTADGNVVIEGKYTSELPKRGLAWMEDESELQLSLQLQMLLTYIVHVFDSDADGKVSKKELQIAAEKRQQRARELKEATRRRAVREL